MGLCTIYMGMYGSGYRIYMDSMKTELSCESLLGSETGSNRVIRGGSWFISAADLCGLRTATASATPAVPSAASSVFVS